MPATTRSTSEAAIWRKFDIGGQMPSSDKTPLRCFMIIFMIGLFQVIIGLIIFMIGLFQVIIGLIIEPALPYFQLDAVLPPESLADERIREKTLELLIAAKGNSWAFWTAAGLSLCVLSAIGLWSLSNSRNERGRS